MKNIKIYFIDMISDTSGHINSKIVIGIVSFVVAVILAFLRYEIAYVISFLSFSAGAFGFSCFDNKSAFQFKTTETITTTKNTDTKIDMAEIANSIKGKKKK